MKTQWQIYKELELIPDSVSAPQANIILSALHLDRVWRSLRENLSRRLSHEQPVEYLERCLALDCSQSDTDSNSNIWQRLWTCLNQPLVFPQLFAESEPQVWQSSDRAGNTWWHVYDPTTGQTAHLESEEEVCIWLEERLYHHQGF